MVNESPYTVVIAADEPFAGRVDAERLRAVVERTLAAEGAGAGVVSIVITDDATVRELNARFLGIDAPTDVLAFPLRATETDQPFVLPTEVLEEIGEIVISLPTAERQAEQHGLALGDEIAHLAVHGALHLLGYDHIEPPDDAQMRAKEEALLAAMGISIRHQAGGHWAGQKESL